MLKIGDKFDSFEDFSEKLEQYKKTVFSDYWIRDCRKIANHARKYPDSTAAKADEKLGYTFLRLACIKGGKHTPRNKSRKTLTLRQGCKAGMFIKLTENGKHLEVKELCEEHSHTVSEALFCSLPRQRIKIPELSSQALRTRRKKKIVQRSVKQELESKEQQNFDKLINMLKDVYHCDVGVLLKQDILEGLYFQDEEMKYIFASYPEIIFVDGTYSMHECRVATYIIMAENSEGHGEVVAVGVLMNESQENIEWFVETFQNLNPLTSKTSIIMSDKDCKERSIFKKLFPNASLQICLFHTLKIFNREVSSKKMGITAVESEVSKSTLQKLAYANSAVEYETIYLEMKENPQVPPVVLSYFEENWQPIKKEWALYLTLNNMCFLNKNNNKVENINLQLKSLISKCSSLEDFIEHFFIVLNSMRVDRQIKMSTQFHKISTQAYAIDSPQDLYQKYLTNYAFKHVSHEIALMNSVKLIHETSNNSGIAETSEGLLQVTPLSCDCLFRKSMTLPCRHIFKFREICDLPLFEQDLCLERWTRSYFLGCYKTSTHLDNDIVDSQVCFQNNTISFENECKQPLTYHQKSELANSVCQRLTELCSEAPSPIFQQRLSLIKQICEGWTEDKSSYNLDIEFQ